MPDTGANPQQIRDRLRRSVKELADLKYALDQSAIVATTDVEGTITYVNDKFCEISKYPREALVGQNHRILNSGLHPIEFFKDMYRTIGRGAVWRGELRNRARDGNYYWVDTTIVPFLNEDGKPYQYIAIRYDITERKRSEAALREQNALAQVGKMAAVVAHEVRNPLAAIRGALQVIGRRLDAGSAEHGVIGEVISRVDGLNEIVQDLLLFAHPRPPLLTVLPVRELLTSTVSLMKQDPTLADVAITVAESDDVIVADAQQLRQVLLNLLINGAQAMHDRGNIRITARAVGNGCELRIQDEGPGISAEAREHLFEPFFTTKHRGTGLGLATARRILDAHGGRLTLECPPGGGTIAVVWVPKGGQ
ncbi:MAG TPA: ATP-binding protein [Vicinamibacterales bacterium]|nr:ATP-binding protein [Vicinamibacterales bacterium]